MLRFAANLSMLYLERPFLDRFEAAAADAFDAVECQFPYAWPIDAIAQRLDAHGLQQVLINMPASSAARGIVDRGAHPDERGLASLPGREEDFRSGFLLAVEYACGLHCPRIHAMAGQIVDGVVPARQRETFVENLRWAAEQVAGTGITILIEPINTRDTPRYFLNRQDDAHAIVAQVDSPHVKVLMDLYHCQVVEGDVTTKLRHWLPTGRVGHLQIAGVPLRQEPDRGELDHDHLFDVVEELGWPGWIGCEYRPALGGEGGTSLGLDWLRRRRGGRRRVAADRGMKRL